MYLSAHIISIIMAYTYVRLTCWMYYVLWHFLLCEAYICLHVGQVHMLVEYKGGILKKIFVFLNVYCASRLENKRFCAVHEQVKKLVYFLINKSYSKLCKAIQVSDTIRFMNAILVLHFRVASVTFDWGCTLYSSLRGEWWVQSIMSSSSFIKHAYLSCFVS